MFLRSCFLTPRLETPRPYARAPRTAKAVSHLRSRVYLAAWRSLWPLSEFSFFPPWFLARSAPLPFPLFSRAAHSVAALPSSLPSLFAPREKKKNQPAPPPPLFFPENAQFINRKKKQGALGQSKWGNEGLRERKKTKKKSPEAPFRDKRKNFRLRVFYFFSPGGVFIYFLFTTDRSGGNSALLVGALAKKLKRGRFAVASLWGSSSFASLLRWFFSMACCFPFFLPVPPPPPPPLCFSFYSSPVTLLLHRTTNRRISTEARMKTLLKQKNSAAALQNFFEELFHRLAFSWRSSL